MININGSKKFNDKMIVEEELSKQIKKLDNQKFGFGVILILGNIVVSYLRFCFHLIQKL